MAGDVILKILEAIEEIGGNAADTFVGIINSGYGASYGRIRYETEKN